MKRIKTAVLIFLGAFAFISCSKEDKFFEAGEAHVLQGNEQTAVYMYGETQCNNRFDIFSNPDFTRGNILNILNRNKITVLSSVSEPYGEFWAITICSAPRYDGYKHYFLIFKADTAMVKNIGLTPQE